MGHVDKVLAIAEIPVTLEEQCMRLSVLSDAILYLQQSEGGTKALSADFCALNDLWWSVDVNRAKKVRESGKPLSPADLILLDQEAGFPVSTPLEMLSVAAKYRVMTKDDVKTLKAEFMAKACDAAGCDLTEAQVKKLFKLFRTYNTGNTGNTGKGMTPE